MHVSYKSFRGEKSDGFGTILYCNKAGWGENKEGRKQEEKTKENKERTTPSVITVAFARPPLISTKANNIFVELATFGVPRKSAKTSLEMPRTFVDVRGDCRVAVVLDADIPA